MYEKLFSRFAEESKASFEDPDIHLSYTDRQRMKAGEYAEVAEDKLPAIKGRIWWIKTNANLALGALIAGSVLTGVSGLLSSVGVEIGLPETTLRDFSLFLFIAFCIGAGALGGMWRMVKLEKQRLLCELVIAHGKEDPAEEKEKAAA